MLRKTFACLLVAGLAGAAVQAQTADELIEKSLKASGGREKVEAIKSFRMTGKAMAPQGIEATVVIEYKQPDKIRSETTFQGMTMIQTLNGTEGWMVAPFTGKKDPEKMSAEDAKQAAEQMDSNPLYLTQYKEKGHTVEYVGKEDIEGTPAYKLKVTKKSGDVLYLYLDSESYLPVKTNGRIIMQGQVMESDITLGDYKAVDGVLFPYSTETQFKGMPGKAVMKISKIEVNPALDDSRFTIPAAAKPAMEEKKETPAPPKP